MPTCKPRTPRTGSGSASSEMDRHLWLIGMMGSGKTAVARALAARWDADWIDTDAEVSRRTGCSIAQLWGDKGEAAFRHMEAAAVERAAAGSPAIIATGGGAVLDGSSVASMRESGLVVWLSVSPDELSRRVGDDHGRPLLVEDPSAARLGEILEQRSSDYREAAHVVVDGDGLSVPDVVAAIEAAWNES